MIRQKYLSLFAVVFCLSLCLVQTNEAFAQENGMTVKDLIAKHLASIGSPETLAKVTSRGMTGKAAVNFIQGASGLLNDGTFLCVSEGKNIGMTMKFNDVHYPGEYIAYNGKETSVKDIVPGQKSPLALFLFTYNSMIKEGFFGGVLSTAWPLLKSGEELTGYQLKKDKIKDKEFYVLEKNLLNINVKLFFDVNTYRHMRTEYLVHLKENIASNSNVVTNNSSMGTAASTPSSASRSSAEFAPTPTIRESQPDSIYKLIEKFDLHAAIGGKASGLILPVSYGIEFSSEGNATFLAQWSVLVDHWMNNGAKVDPSFFIASK
jgi:hypothetical protein